jgi:poly(A) polymerase Pap1
MNVTLVRFLRDDEAYGITPPISKSLPTEADLRQSKELEETLRQYGMFESPEESEKRYAHHERNAVARIALHSFSFQNASGMSLITA